MVELRRSVPYRDQLVAGAHQRSTRRASSRDGAATHRASGTAPHVARHEQDAATPIATSSAPATTKRRSIVYRTHRGLAEVRAERVDERHGRAIDALDLVEQGRISAGSASGLDQHVDALTDALEADLLVGRCPTIDGARHVRHARKCTKSAISPRRRRGGCGPAGTCSCRVEIGPVERETYAPVAERDRHRRAGTPPRSSRSCVVA